MKKYKKFTLLEILISMAISLIIIIILTQFLGFTQKLWMNSKQKNILFQEANIAFAIMVDDFTTNYNYKDLELFETEENFYGEVVAIHFVSRKPFIEQETTDLNEISYRLKDNELQRREIYPSHSDFNIIADVIKPYQKGEVFEVLKIWNNNKDSDFNTVIPYVKVLTFSLEDMNFVKTVSYPSYLRINITLMTQSIFEQEQKWLDIPGNDPKDSPFAKYERSFMKLIKIKK